MERGGWYRRNRILIWVCALTTVNQLGFGSIVPVVPLYALSFHVPQSAIGLTIAIYGLARFLVNVPAGQLADRIGRRGTLTLGALFTVVGNLLCAAAPAYLPFLGARFVAGVVGRRPTCYPLRRSSSRCDCCWRNVASRW